MFAFYQKPRKIISCLQIINSNLGFLDISRNITNASLPSVNNKSCSKDYSFTVSYLINNIGLPPKVAIIKSKGLKFESSDKPDSVVALFRNHGFNKTQISKIIAKFPQLLTFNPDINLLPKLKFLSSIGASCDVVALNPCLLRYSFEKRLVPYFDYFSKDMLLSHQQIVHILRNHNYVLRGLHGNNVKLLEKVGVGMKFIGQLVYRKPRALYVSHNRFKTLVHELLELKFDPSKSPFVVALSVRIGLSNVTWAHKLEVYKRWGWTEHEVLLAFRKNPMCMSLSEENIMSGMDVLVNKMGYESMAIAKTPVALTYSLKSRIIPRCSVIRVLQMKGLINRDLSSLSLFFLIMTEKSFEDKYIIRYQEQLPQLLSAYQSKLGILELIES